MQEQIYRDDNAAASVQKQQEQQQSIANQMSRNTQQRLVQRASHSNQLQQLHQSKIITPTKSTQYELLAGMLFLYQNQFLLGASSDSRRFNLNAVTVKEVFYQVEEAFKSR
jgi:23S rRNA maturation mini-RNase III